MAKKRSESSGDVIVVNRRAGHDYRIDATMEAGLVLTGTEVKSLRSGKASIAQAFATVRGGEVWLQQAHIPEYDFGNRHNHDPTRRRKLLLNRAEIAELEAFTREAGRTLVPMKLYWKGGRAKLLIGLASGKAQHDKRRDLAARDAQRDAQRALRERQRR